MVGAARDNFDTIKELAGKAAGLKMYLNDTYTTLKMDWVTDWANHFANWPKSAPLCVHAEGRVSYVFEI